MPAAQAVHAVADAPEYRLLLQLKQTVAPVDDWYVPPAHPLHALAPAAEYAPVEHAPQLVAPVLP